jgi:CheY-like chemotaxis protein
VLVVDDEPAVLQTTSRQLRRAGYEVLEASSGRAALKLVESRDNVSVAVIDRDMPGMHGDEVDRAILRQWRHIKIIAVSGRPPGSELPPKIDFLPKPFRSQVLIAKIEACVGTGTRTTVASEGDRYLEDGTGLKVIRADGPEGVVQRDPKQGDSV